MGVPAVAGVVAELQSCHGGVPAHSAVSTEWTGETAYSQTIERLTAGAVTRNMLLAKWPAVEHTEAADAAA